MSVHEHSAAPTGWIAEGRLYPGQPGPAGVGGFDAWGRPVLVPVSVHEDGDLERLRLMLEENDEPPHRTRLGCQLNPYALGLLIFVLGLLVLFGAL